jgi:hypothetical protein
MAMLSWLVSWCSEFVTLARSILRYHCEFESQYRYTHRTCGNQSQGGIFLDGQFASKSSLKCSVLVRELPVLSRHSAKARNRSEFDPDGNISGKMISHRACAVVRLFPVLSCSCQRTMMARFGGSETGESRPPCRSIRMAFA